MYLWVLVGSQLISSALIVAMAVFFFWFFLQLKSESTHSELNLLSSALPLFRSKFCKWHNSFGLCPQTCFRLDSSVLLHICRCLCTHVRATPFIVSETMLPKAVTQTFFFEHCLLAAKVGNVTLSLSQATDVVTFSASLDAEVASLALGGGSGTGRCSNSK